MNKNITIRLGYACICTSLDGITSSKTYQYSKFSVEKDYQKLEEQARLEYETEKNIKSKVIRKG